MKNIFLLIILFSTLIKSQSVTIDITKSGLGEPDGYYRKDLNNLLNPFEGTYIYTNGNKIFKILLKKMIMQPDGNNYEDIIIGEYQYIENGIEKVNTLANINILYPNQFLKHSIAGNRIITKITSRLWPCPQCSSNEKRIGVLIRDKTSGRSADFFMRRTVVNGQEVMQANIQGISSKSINVNNPEPPQPDFALPIGEFTMIKQ
ncbi:hypothetical protein ASG22_17630 [Chryseobacterium sp. Leaf405]|uniref:DUF6705 family protein n=1 Tax=Chryseobacterium sp. Leaf405 TaxID=1736367 RepID=UPI0006F9F2A0|nr:DUF6705 family protein [Chryseobacterium sp. Leaf405]KQT33042.1 hypothetical protein ASG22_17630 [Chryseobacterium sp. Leaf405]